MGKKQYIRMDGWTQARMHVSIDVGQYRWPDRQVNKWKDCKITGPEQKSQLRVNGKVDLPAQVQLLFDTQI